MEPAHRLRSRLVSGVSKIFDERPYQLKMADTKLKYLVM